MSYAFLPRGADGAIQPVSLGWTLNYEMYFYVVFAAFIWQVRHRALVTGCAPALGTAIAVHPLIPADATALVFWTDPIVAEFLFDMAIAALATTGIGLSRRVSVELALLALLWLIGGYVSGIGGSELVTTGLPVAILVILCNGVRTKHKTANRAGPAW